MIADVIAFVEMIRRQHEAHRTGREILELDPNERRHVQPLCRTLEQLVAARAALLDGNTTAAREHDDELMLGAVCVGSARLSGGNVIDGKDAFDRKRHVPAIFREHQAAALIYALRQFYFP